MERNICEIINESTPNHSDKYFFCKKCKKVICSNCFPDHVEHKFCCFSFNELPILVNRLKEEISNKITQETDCSRDLNIFERKINESYNGNKEIDYFIKLGFKKLKENLQNDKNEDDFTNFLLNVIDSLNNINLKKVNKNSCFNFTLNEDEYFSKYSILYDNRPMIQFQKFFDEIVNCNIEYKKKINDIYSKFFIKDKKNEKENEIEIKIESYDVNQFNFNNNNKEKNYKNENDYNNNKKENNNLNKINKKKNNHIFEKDEEFKLINKNSSKSNFFEFDENLIRYEKKVDLNDNLIFKKKESKNDNKEFDKKKFSNENNFLGKKQENEKEKEKIIPVKKFRFDENNSKEIPNKKNINKTKEIPLDVDNNLDKEIKKTNNEKQKINNLNDNSPLKDNTLFFFYFQNNENNNNILFLYNNETKSISCYQVYTQKENNIAFPFKRSKGVNLNNSFLITGGYEEKNNLICQNCYKLIYKDDNIIIKEESKMNMKRASHNIIYIKSKNKVFVCSGEYNNDCEYLDLNNNKNNKWIKLKCKMNEYRANASLFCINDRFIYCVGGFNFELRKYIYGYEVLDLDDKNLKWNYYNISNLNNCCNRGIINIDNKNIIFVGGTFDNNYLNNVYKIEIHEDKDKIKNVMELSNKITNYIMFYNSQNFLKFGTKFLCFDSYAKSIEFDKINEIFTYNNIRF